MDISKIATVVAMTVPLTAHAGGLFLADNNVVAAAWQETMGGAAPQVVTQEGGGTKIEWNMGGSAKYYNTSATGDSTVQPLSGGDFFGIDVNADVKATSPEGRIAYANFRGAINNDRSVQSNRNFLQTAQAGIFNEPQGYSVVLGDAALNFSDPSANSLGTNTAIRGLYVQKIIGQGTLSLGAGLNTPQAPTWNAVVNESSRSQYLRNVVAAKFDTLLGEGMSAYVTLQSWADDPASYDRALSGLAPATSRAGTVGFVHQRGKLTLSSELGLSRFEERDSEARTDHAYVVDATWQAEGYSLQGGHHYIGADYSANSAAAQPGVQETYVGGNWQAATWLALNGSLRHSKNQQGGGNAQVNAASSNMIDLGQTITFGKNWAGLSLTLSENLSDGRNGDGGNNQSGIYSSILSYDNEAWHASTSYNYQTTKNSAASTSDSQTSFWGVSLSRTFSTSVDNPTWTFTPLFGASIEDQNLVTIAQNTRTTRWGLGFTGSRVGWVEFGMSYNHTVVESTTAPDDVKTQAYHVNVGHAFTDKNRIDLYADSTRINSGLSGVSSTALTVGVTATLAF